MPASRPSRTNLPQLAIVGRPNVGKSSLLNRLAKRRVSIVDPTPGVTRDRVSTVLEIDPPLETPKGTPGRLVELSDTGGYGVYTAEGGRFNEIGDDLSRLTGDIEQQILGAIRNADLILFAVDAQAGITPLDQKIATIIREAGAESRVLPVANKVDSEKWLTDGLEAASFGFGEPVCISAENNFGVRRLLDAIYERLENDLPTVSETPGEPEMNLAIVGKRNAGKSTLINALAGASRVIVSEIAGTTRDSVDVRFEIDGRSMLAIDTAGVRKKKSFADDIEFYAYSRLLQAVRRADVVALLLDATADVSQVDKKLAMELQNQYKPTVIVVNKWDLVADKLAPDDYLDYLTDELRGFDFAPIVFISAKDGEGVRDVVAMAFNLFQQARHRESTGRLNSVMEKILRQRGPSSKLGTKAKLYYVSQVEVTPPTIVMVVNDPALFEGGYERYLLNRLREELPYSEVPIRLVFHRRKRKDLDAMKSAGRAKARQSGE